MNAESLASKKNTSKGVRKNATAGVSCQKKGRPNQKCCESEKKERNPLKGWGKRGKGREEELQKKA